MYSRRDRQTDRYAPTCMFDRQSRCCPGVLDSSFSLWPSQDSGDRVSHACLLMTLPQSAPRHSPLPGGMESQGSNGSPSSQQWWQNTFTPTSTRPASFALVLTHVRSSSLETKIFAGTG